VVGGPSGTKSSEHANCGNCLTLTVTHDNRRPLVAKIQPWRLGGADYWFFTAELTFDEEKGFELNRASVYAVSTKQSMYLGKMYMVDNT